MLLAFELTMPTVGSWNGTWSGEGRHYVRVHNVGKTSKAKPGAYEYAFGDGWTARVTVRKVDSAEARKRRRKSAGFCGYDWMIAEIRELGRIRPLSERTRSERYQ